MIANFGPWTDSVQCPRSVDGSSCGLLLGHDSPCAPFTPGYYLLPPLIHPIDLLWFSSSNPWPCFTCGRPFDSYTIGPAIGYLTRAQLLTVYPCGCAHRLPAVH